MVGDNQGPTLNGTKLTSANLAAHNAASNRPSDKLTVQSWLATTGDRLIRSRDARAWNELCKEDNVAKEIEEIVQKGRQS